MRTKAAIVYVLVSAIFVFMTVPASYAAQTLEKPRNDRDASRSTHLQDEIRHRLVMLPYYSVFDWLEAEVKPNGEVTLKGQVVEPTLKPAAESEIKKLEGLVRVVNNIEVLPFSPMDDQIRQRVYRSIYDPNSSLFKYALQSVPPIHIIVKNARVELYGMVLTNADRQLAFMSAWEVPGIFDVENHLLVERDRNSDVTIS